MGLLKKYLSIYMYSLFMKYKCYYYFEYIRSFMCVFWRTKKIEPLKHFLELHVSFFVDQKLREAAFPY